MKAFVTLLLAGATAAAFSAGASAATVTYQNGTNDPFTGNPYTGTQNTYIDSAGDYPSSGVYSHLYNFGASGVVFIVADGTYAPNPVRVRRGLFRFDISSMLGHVNPANITGGTLTLYLDPNGYYANGSGAGSGYNNPANSLEADAITDANAGWQQGDKDGDTTTTGGSTWDSQNEYWGSTNTNWAGSHGLETAGTDYDNANPLGTYTLPASVGGAPIPMTFNVSASLLQHWLTDTNAGVLLRLTNEDMNTANSEWDQTQIVRTGSKNWAATYYPKLQIDYSPVPEPATAALVLIGGGLLALRRRRRA